MNIISNRQRKIGYLYLLNTIFFFSTYEIVNKIIIGSVDVFQINFIRFFIGGLILWIFAFVKKEISISLRDFACCTFVGIINVVLSMSLINLSISIPGASAAVTAVLFSCNPIFVSIIAAFADRERLDRRKVMALVIGMTGTVLISCNKMNFNIHSLIGPTLAVLSALFFGVYTVLGKKLASRIGSLRMNAYSFLSGSVVLFIILTIMRRPTVLYKSSVIGWVLYLSIFVTGLAYLTYFKGLSYIGAGKGSLVFFLKPVLAAILAVLFLKEKINIMIIIGIGLVLSGIWFVFGKQLMGSREKLK